MAHYDVGTYDGLDKWWYSGLGSGARHSDLMDDTSPQPGVSNANGVWLKISNGAWDDTGAPEYTIAVTTEPDGDSGDDQCIYHKEDTDWLVRGTAGALNAGEWDWVAGTLSVRLLDDGDPDTEDIYVYYAWSHFMTERDEDQSYEIHCFLEHGDGTTPTTLLCAYGESIRYDDDIFYLIKDYAHITLGVYDSTDDGYGKNGAFWSVKSTAPGGVAVNIEIFDTDATHAQLDLYGSVLSFYGTYPSFNVNFRYGTVTVYDSQIVGADSGRRLRIYFRVGSTVYLTRCKFFNIYLVNTSTVVLSDHCTFLYCRTIELYADTQPLTDPVFKEVYQIAVYREGNAYLINPSMMPSVIYIDDADGILNLQYTINLHVTKANGDDLEDVLFTLYGSSGTEPDATDATYEDDMFPGAVDSNVDGDIAEQTVTVRKWVGTSETETDYNLFKLVATHADYPTLTMENITIDAPITWRIDMGQSTSDLTAIVTAAVEAAAVNIKKVNDVTLSGTGVPNDPWRPA